MDKSASFFLSHIPALLNTQVLWSLFLKKFEKVSKYLGISEPDQNSYSSVFISFIKGLH